MIWNINELENISPYTETKLDCFQNILITILTHYNIDVDFFGAIWPWLFEINYINEKAVIANKVICNEERMKTLYNITLAKRNFKMDIISDVRRNIANMPIIVNLDQYYVPHHYPHIFNKKHGRHSLLLLRYRQGKGVFCLDTMPEYKGFIDTENLVMGIKSFPYKFGHLKYCWLESEGINYNVDQESLFMYFIQLLKATYIINNLPSHKLDLGLKNILYIIKEIDEGSEAKLNEFIDKLFQGTWVWEIDRSPNWLIRYLKTDLVTKKLGSDAIKKTTERIADVNNKVVLAFRILYKYSISRKKNDFIKGKELLTNAQQQENELLEYLLKIAKT